MTILHLSTPESFPRTLCGAKLERGVHRVHPCWLDAHLAGRPDEVVACEACEVVQRDQARAAVQQMLDL